MTDPIAMATIAAAALLGLTILSLAALKGWSGWLDLQRTSLAGVRGAGEDAGPSPAQRIELADLRERVRKLEAIAAGVDL